MSDGGGAMAEGRGPRRLLCGPAGSGKTARLIDRLLALRRDAARSWDGIVVLTRSPIAAEQFRRRLEAAADAAAERADGYRMCRIAPAGHWFAAIHKHGLFGIGGQRVWMDPVEREAIRDACLAEAPAWNDPADARSADVADYHEAIHQWAGTLRLNGLDPTAVPARVRQARNGDRALRLAKVLTRVAERKRREGALGGHDVLPALLAALTDPGPLEAFQADVRCLMVDDAQDLPLPAIPVLARWAEGGGELWITADPESPTARFRGAIPGTIVEALVGRLHLQPEDLSASTSHARAAAVVLRGTAPATPTGPEALVTLVRTPDEIEEAYEIARRLRHAVYASQRHDAPLRFGDCGIVMQSPQPTSAYLTDALRFYDVPFVRTSGTPLVNAPIVRYCLRYLETLDGPALGNPPADLVAHGLAGLLAAPPDADSAESPEAANVVWVDRWHALRREWRRRGLLRPVLARLVREQLLPALHRAATYAEHRAEAWGHLRRLDELAHTVDMEHRTREATDRLATLNRVLCAEREQAAPETVLDVDAVRVVTPYAARDLPLRWLAIAGFTAGRWPPTARPHVLRLDAATAQWLGRDPLTLWAPDAESQDRDMRALLAAVVERCDGPILVSVPQEGAQGEALDPSPWLADLLPYAVEERPLVDRAQGLMLDAALTSAEAAAALAAVHAASDAKAAAARLLDLRLDTPLRSGAAEPVALRDRQLSATLLNTFLTCPRQCFYTQLLRASDTPEPMERANRLGRLIHEVLQRLHAPDRWRSWSLADAAAIRADALGLLDTLWNDQQMAAVYPNTMSAERMYERAAEMVASYVRWAVRTLAGCEILATEQPFSFAHGDAGVKGFIDRIDRLPDGGVRIIDYKTGKVDAGGKTVANKFANVHGKDDWRPKDLQLVTYLLGSGSMPTIGSAAVEAALCGLKVKPGAAPKFPIVAWSDAPGDDGRKHRYRLSDAERGQARAVFDQTVARVLAGRYPPEPRSPGECRQCPARLMCFNVRLVDEEPDEGEDE